MRQFHDMDFSLIEKWKQTIINYRGGSFNDLRVLVFNDIWSSDDPLLIGDFNKYIMVEGYVVVILYTEENYPTVIQSAYVFVNSRFVYWIPNVYSSNEIGSNFMRLINVHYVPDQSTAVREFDAVVDTNIG